MLSNGHNERAFKWHNISFIREHLEIKHSEKREITYKVLYKAQPLTQPLTQPFVCGK